MSKILIPAGQNAIFRIHTPYRNCGNVTMFTNKEISYVFMIACIGWYRWLAVPQRNATLKSSAAHMFRSNGKNANTHVAFV